MTDSKAYKPRFATPQQVGEYLTKAGWTREKSVTKAKDRSGRIVSFGEGDFDKVCERVCKMYQSPRRGLLVSGKYGCGKTSLVLALRDYGKRFDMTLPEDVEMLDHDGGYQSTYWENFDRSVLIDDLGAESGLISRGTGNRQITIRKPVACEFVCSYFRYGKGRLWITTNLDISTDEFADTVGGRVFDRLKTMVIPVMMTGASKRKWVI